MTRSEVSAVVVDVLVSVQVTMGLQPPTITPATKPIGDLPLFCSIISEDTTVGLFIQLGLQASVDENPFIANRQACSVDQIVDRLCSLLEAKASHE
jgi:hypothetical protein